MIFGGLSEFQYRISAQNGVFPLSKGPCSTLHKFHSLFAQNFRLDWSEAEALDLSPKAGVTHDL